MQPAKMAINTGTPTPTLTPMMTLLLTPPVLPLTARLLGEDCVGATYDVGLPVVAVNS